MAKRIAHPQTVATMELTPYRAEGFAHKYDLGMEVLTDRFRGTGVIFGVMIRGDGWPIVYHMRSTETNAVEVIAETSIVGVMVAEEAREQTEVIPGL